MASGGRHPGQQLGDLPNRQEPVGVASGGQHPAQHPASSAAEQGSVDLHHAAHAAKPSLVDLCYHRHTLPRISATAATQFIKAVRLRLRQTAGSLRPLAANNLGNVDSAEWWKKWAFHCPRAQEICSKTIVSAVVAQVTGEHDHNHEFDVLDLT